MLRDKSLIPLSHQHQHALALCVRIERASPIPESDLEAWQKEIAQLFQSEIAGHFRAEEEILFPEALKFDDLCALVEELIADHEELRMRFDRGATGIMSSNDLATLAQKLSAHIRKEERQLFEGMQKLLSPEELAAAGRKLDEALKNAEQACLLPTDATRLRAAK